MPEKILGQFGAGSHVLVEIIEIENTHIRIRDVENPARYIDIIKDAFPAFVETINSSFKKITF